ncbi:MAG: metallochaperone AztD [Devosia sp.]|nr:metal-binding protein ZinT [Devosia sp.]UYN99900.1 MAG: metallochaperone AztD [Devosia sp.]
MKKLALGVSALALSAGLGGTALAEEGVTAWRLFVSDHAEPIVHVFDALTNEELTHFDIAGPASLYRSESGATVYAVQGAANTVTAISSGIRLDDHGDHADISVSEPGLPGFAVEGQSPSHFVEHDGHFAAFFDGEGIARVFSERDALESHAEFTEVKANAPHHGVVVPYHDYSVVSVWNPEGDGSVAGVQIVDAEGNPVGDVVECVGLHGEAFSGNLGVIGGCEGGILVISEVGGQPHAELLPFQEGLGEGRVSTIIGGRGLQYFLGNWDADTVSLIEPEADEPYRLVDLPTRRVHFVVDPVRPRFAYVFTEDGQLHQLDVIAGEITNSLALTEPYSMDGHWSDPRPRVAVAGDHIYVSDPLAGKLHVIDAESFVEDGEIAVEGKPFNLVAVGGSGADHDNGEDHDHDHAGHGHDHDDKVYQGYFEDSQIADRTLSDWEGDWQSVYPLLLEGTLAPVMEHKAEAGTMTAEEYTAYYDVGYKTDVNRITIEGDTVTFFGTGEPAAAQYAYDGYEVLTYEKGNRGVRFIFAKTGGDEAAPKFIQFSDHAIAPQEAGHYHLYWGNDRAALLDELTNWPTYYPSALSADEIVEEMIAH